MQTQSDKILDYLQAGHSLNAMDALSLFQCFRLASRISDLRRQGHNIQSEFIRVPSGKKVKKYWLAEEPAPDEQSELYATTNQHSEEKIHEYFCKGKQLAYLL